MFIVMEKWEFVSGKLRSTRGWKAHKTFPTSEPEGKVFHFLNLLTFQILEANLILEPALYMFHISFY